MSNWPNKGPGNGWYWARQSLSGYDKGDADASGCPGGATILLSCSIRVWKIMQESTPFLFASIVLCVTSCTDPSIKSVLARNLTKHPKAFVRHWSQFHSLDVQWTVFKKKTNKHDNTLQKWYPSSAVTKLRARTTATMRVSLWATPARAQTEQLTAQRPTNKCFHIYPPPPLWDSWGLNGKQLCGCTKGVGSLARIGKTVFGSLCCRISCLCVPLPFWAACLSWWNQVVNRIGVACFKDRKSVV